MHLKGQGRVADSERIDHGESVPSISPKELKLARGWGLSGAAVATRRKKQGVFQKVSEAWLAGSVGKGFAMQTCQLRFSP